MEKVEHAKWGKFTAIRVGDNQNWHMNVFYADEQGTMHSHMYTGHGIPEQQYKLAGHDAPANLEWREGNGE